MRFTVVSAGAIGRLTGASLARTGHTVRFVDVVEEYVRTINKQGLRSQAALTSVPRQSP